MGDGISINTSGDGILVKDNVVGESSVVLEGDCLTSLDGESGGLESQSSSVRSKLDGGCEAS